MKPADDSTFEPCIPNWEKPMSMRLKNKVAIITGASQGIGQTMALHFAKEGAKLCLISRREEALKEMVLQLKLPQSDVLVLPLDVTDQHACEQAARGCFAHFGGIDILVNNAGIYRSKPFMDHLTNDFKQLMDVNVYGAVHMVQACFEFLQKSSSARIINMASTAGKWGSKNQSAYNTSKHALVGLTRCLALEFATHAITVNAICPGFVQTAMLEELKSMASQSAGVSEDEFYLAALARIPLGRVMKPEEISSMAVYLASAESSGITGQSIHVDGGMVFS
jgi:NAD(P)-dependent dehydrogenase (short-subunit alcohol dehydrogenase family)